jgi:hypothetical protein
MIDKKKEQLGMNPSTASGRLVKDILWSFIVKNCQDNCCKCGNQMTRETFSIEHVKPWLDSDNPVDLYFDLDNISFSHLTCNIADARRPEAKSKEEAQAHKNEWARNRWQSLPKEERQRIRKLKRLKYGC